MAQLNRRKSHIALLQESHLTQAEALKLQRKWRGQLFYTSYLAFARGAVIWVRSGTQFAVVEQRVDTNGRYVLVHGTLDGRHIVLGSVYAPNSEQDKFLEVLTNTLTGWEGYPWVIGGDFNMILDVDLDRSHPPLQGTSCKKLAEVLKGWTEGWHIGQPARSYPVLGQGPHSGSYMKTATHTIRRSGVPRRHFYSHHTLLQGECTHC